MAFSIGREDRITTTSKAAQSESIGLASRGRRRRTSKDGKRNRETRGKRNNLRAKQRAEHEVYSAARKTQRQMTSTKKERAARDARHEMMVENERWEVSAKENEARGEPELYKNLARTKRKRNEENEKSKCEREPQSEFSL